MESSKCLPEKLPEDTKCIFGETRGQKTTESIIISPFWKISTIRIMMQGSTSTNSQIKCVLLV